MRFLAKMAAVAAALVSLTVGSVSAAPQVGAIMFDDWRICDFTNPEPEFYTTMNPARFWLEFYLVQDARGYLVGEAMIFDNLDMVVSEPFAIRGRIAVGGAGPVKIAFQSAVYGTALVPYVNFLGQYDGNYAVTGLQTVRWGGYEQVGTGFEMQLPQGAWVPPVGGWTGWGNTFVGNTDFIYMFNGWDLPVALTSNVNGTYQNVKAKGRAVSFQLNTQWDDFYYAYTVIYAAIRFPYGVLNVTIDDVYVRPWEDEMMPSE